MIKHVVAFHDSKPRPQAIKARTQSEGELLEDLKLCKAATSHTMQIVALISKNQ